MTDFISRTFQSQAAEDPPGSRILYISVTDQAARPEKRFGIVLSRYEEPRLLGEGGERTEQAGALCDRMLQRKPAPGWDEIAEDGLRAICLPVHREDGVVRHVCVFEAGANGNHVQVFLERVALMLGPVVDTHVRERDQRRDFGSVAAGASAEDAGRAPAVGEVELATMLVQNLDREIQAANSKAELERLNARVEDIKAVMMQNVEAILDRQEKIESFEQATQDLLAGAGMFRRQARSLRRFHLRKQVIWGVAAGTAITAGIALPIVVIAVA